MKLSLKKVETSSHKTPQKTNLLEEKDSTVLNNPDSNIILSNTPSQDEKRQDNLPTAKVSLLGSNPFALLVCDEDNNQPIAFQLGPPIEDLDDINKWNKNPDEVKNNLIEDLESVAKAINREYNEITTILNSGDKSKAMTPNVINTWITNLPIGKVKS